MDSPQVANNLAQLEKQIVFLTEQLRQVQTSSDSGGRKEPRMALPDKYSGELRTLRDFLASVRTIFRAQPSRYPTAEIQVAFTASLLSGQALSWFRITEANNPEVLHNFNSFSQALERMFGDPNRQQYAQRELRRIKQGRSSALNYSTKFRELALDAHFNDEAHQSMFYEGLNEEVKDALSVLPEPPETFDDLVRIVLRIDNRLTERRREKRQSWISHPPRNQNSHPPSNQNPMQMDLDSLLPRRRLSKAEKARRRELNLCLYCGDEGHVARTCPNKAAPSENDLEQ